MAVSYPGGKEGAGVWQRIISAMPPHSVYVEAFAGGAAVLRHKLPAIASIAIERDEVPARALRAVLPPGCLVIRGDAVLLLPALRLPADAVVYCDPPYLLSARIRHRTIYRCELSESDHRRLLRVVMALRCRVLVSHYPCPLYNEALRSWRVVVYGAMTRGGYVVQEALWCNFPEPLRLHDSRWVGRDFRERERLKRKRARLLLRLRAMPAHERGFLLDALREVEAASIAGSIGDAGVERSLIA